MINGDKIKVLDCTLRDGGYINDWHFGENNITSIINNLIQAKIDIIECGFIRNVDYSKDSSVFPSMESLAKTIYPKNENVLYAVMIEYHNMVDKIIPVYDGKGADIIRVTFRRNEWAGAKRVISELIEKGYKVCVQPVGTASYDDETLLNLIKEVNEIKPYALYLVDTLGLLYIDDLRRFFYLIDNNLAHNICLGFHSHNNLQMSFSNSQELIKLAKNRTVIIDSSCYGMGRGVGNLATELIADYINRNIEQRYSITPLLNIIDNCLMPIYAHQRWGYDLPYYLSAVVKCHPNYASYLMKKETLSIENIEKILSLIPNGKRNEFDSKLIEELYLNYQNYDISDNDSFVKISSFVKEKEIVLIGSGSSIIKYKNIISDSIKDKYVISVNFIPDEFKIDAIFISNEKRLNNLKFDNKICVLSTSNLKIKDSLVFNYGSLLGEGDASDNAAAMLIRLLKKINVTKLYLAGLDGYDVDSANNYVVESFKKSLDFDSANQKNQNISKQLKLALSGVDYELLTPTKYEI